MKETNSTVFVLMPFGNNGEYQGGSDESEYVYSEIIRPGIKAALETQTHAPRIFREMDRNRSGSITASIVRNLVEAEIVVVDITGRNPNVFLELGMRYALRNKMTILLSQTGSPVPFDIAGYRHIEYHRFRPRDAIQRLAEFIREGRPEQAGSDSPVFDVFSHVATLLLVDDHFGTGRTANQAIAFMREQFGEKTRVLYIPLVARHPEYLSFVDDYLPYNYKHTDGQNVFNIQREEFINKTQTSATYFPYLEKEIRR